MWLPLVHRGGSWGQQFAHPAVSCYDIVLPQLLQGCPEEASFLTHFWHVGLFLRSLLTIKISIAHDWMVTVQCFRSSEEREQRS